MQSEIKTRRTALGMTQEDLAEKLGVSHITVSRWERGDSLPSAKNVKGMIKIFNVVDGQKFFWNLIVYQADKKAAN